jgi:endo-1,4-beta-mannosidase
MIYLRPSIWLLLAALLFACAADPTPTPPAPLALCTQAEIDAAVQATGAYTPSTLVDFVRVDGQRFKLGDAPYAVRGFNYYPARYPWRRFLTEADTDTFRRDFALFRAVGVNTLRIFLWHEALFLCPGSGAVPNPAGFQRLDTVLRLAAEHNLRLIVTLHDMPDLEAYPLYTDAPHHQQQRVFLLARYRDEAAILAWDVRNEGDIDYGTHQSFPAKFDRAVVLGWLERVAQEVRSLDGNHLVTAGWLYDAESTAPYVDFVSFHHWTDAAQLAGRIAPIRAATDKPILLQEVGYSTQRVSPPDQTALLTSIITTAHEQQLAGWLIWAAFDFPIDRSCYPTPCLSPDNGEHYFGVWQVDGTAKPAAALIGALP